MLDVDTHSNDFTQPLRGYARTVLSLAPELCGYILVKASPSCGYDRVKRFNEKGNVVAYDQPGVFAAALAELDPLLPLEDLSGLTVHCKGRGNGCDLFEQCVTRMVWEELKSSAERILKRKTLQSLLETGEELSAPKNDCVDDTGSSNINFVE